jgi:hypothetical protein
MKAGLALFLHSARRARALVLAVAALLAGFQILLAFAARSLEELNTFGRLAALVPRDLARATFQVVPELTLNLGALLLCWGGIALAVASAARRRSVAGAITALAAMACYMTDLIAQVWQPLRPVAEYSPFHYYSSLNLITGSSDATRHALTLVCIAAAGFALAYLNFRRRDL